MKLTLGALCLISSLAIGGIGLTSSGATADYRGTCDIDASIGIVVEFQNNGSSTLSCGGHVIYKVKAATEWKCQLHTSNVGAGARKVHVCQFYGEHNRPVEILKCHISCS